jgi:hypothetical protein
MLRLTVAQNLLALSTPHSPWDVISVGTMGELCFAGRALVILFLKSLRFFSPKDTAIIYWD